LAREVECKIRLQEYEVAAVRERIGTLFAHIPPRNFFKADTYLRYHADDGDLVRVRVDGDEIIVTKKFKDHLGEGVESNRELEFSVAAGQYEAVRDFFLALGYRPLLEKEKRGTAWTEDACTVELVHVARLGWFLELEMLLADNHTEAELASALDTLKRLRETLEVEWHPLEGRYYMEMLKETAKESG